jgi:hypothetical protein
VGCSVASGLQRRCKQLLARSIVGKGNLSIATSDLRPASSEPHIHHLTLSEPPELALSLYLPDVRMFE